jgi:membrane protein DedA with SNARE-associated domain
VFAIAFAESLVFISLLIPASAILLAIGALQVASGGSVWVLIAAATVGATVGDCASYILGRRYRAGITSVWPFARYRNVLPVAEQHLIQWGPISIVLTKFLGALRAFVPVAAGVVRMPAMIFVPVSALSCFVWAATLLAAGSGAASVVGR